MPPPLDVSLSLEVLSASERWTAWEGLCAAYGREPDEAFAELLAGAAELALRQALGEAPEDPDAEEWDA